MMQMESFALASEQSELLKAADALNGGDTISIDELDKPIALCDSNTKIGDTDGDQIIKKSCRNEKYENSEHPSGVQFERKVIVVEGQNYEVVVPNFPHEFEMILPEELHIAPDREQFDACNKALKEEVAKNLDLREKFTDEQIEQIENGDRPDGYVWHHAENPGQMQLVPRDVHDQTGHTGGKSFWGGGKENR